MTNGKMLYTAVGMAIAFFVRVSKKGLSSLAIGVGLLAMISCSASPPVKAEPPDADIFWGAEANAIVLKFKATKDLNLNWGQAASLSICIYQLSDPRLFEQLHDQGAEGLTALASCKSFGETVVAYKRLFLEPGQYQETFLDRQEGVRFVGVVAGYYTLESERCARLFPVPITKISDGLLSKHREPAQLVVDLHFGPSWPELPEPPQKE